LNKQEVLTDLLPGPPLSANEDVFMTGYISAEFDGFADIYDVLHAAMLGADESACIQMLSKLASGKAALELAVGTGRIAVPLAQTGVRVSGVDISTKMLQKLRSKPGAEQIAVVVGNFADVAVQGRFDLIYVLVSFGYLRTQAEQIRCLRNVREKLTERGAFVIQAAVPNESVFREHGDVDSVFTLPSADGTSESVILSVGYPDLLQQVVHHQLVSLGNEGVRIYNHTTRFVWPAELDLMAHMAGLTLDGRWSSWQQDPFTAKSRTQIVVYRRNGTG
jgi:SAM-dependent methyltransferase